MKAMGMYYAKSTGSPAPTDEQVKIVADRAFKKMDTNKDRGLSLKEFVLYSLKSNGF